LKKNMMKARPKKQSLGQRAEAFASETSIHRIGYIFDRRLGAIDRLLWTILFLRFFTVASVLTWKTWKQWQNNQVMNT